MTRQVLCIPCAENRQKLHKTPNPYPGEHIKMLKGSATRAFLCDDCGKEIHPSVECVTYTLYTARDAVHTGSLPYWPWEAEYISGAARMKWPAGSTNAPAV